MSLPELSRIHEEWTRWSATADKRNDGWEEYFPKWRELINAAIQTMRSVSLSGQDLELLDHCWSISEETEELSLHASEHLDALWDVVVQMTKSKDWKVRWQAFNALAAGGSNAEGILRVGLLDENDYVKRRALLSLAEVGPSDADRLAEQFVQHNDAYLRLAAINLLRRCGSASERRRVGELLANDSADFVRRAAQEL